MKILLEKYPKGSFKGQQSDGRYIDGYLYENLNLMADKISADMTFLGICFSSTLEVGTGKSVFCTQVGEAWTDIINKKYNLNYEFTEKNLVFNPKDLIERAFQLPRYSFILLDEWEEASYWSELAIALRGFLRKCRQLNLFIMVIIPNWFQLPLSYAVSRSVFSVDVRFETGFKRGFFDFYGFESKKNLYIKGKKFHNYKVSRADFIGRFTDGYGLPEKEYRASKLNDMLEYDAKEKRKPTEKEVKISIFKLLYKNLKLSVEELAEGFEIARQTGYNWVNMHQTQENGSINTIYNTYNKILNNKEVVWNEEEIVKGSKQKN